MKHAFCLCLMGLLLIDFVEANEISLLENGVISNMAVQELLVNQEELIDEEDDDEPDDFQEMDDFIKIENAKLKDIKLLTLDLEKAGLELKKKEIEQELMQLNLSEVGVSTIEQGSESVLKRPLIRLLGIFVGLMRKEVVLSINGNRFHLKEGEENLGVRVKMIKSNQVTVEYVDGQTQELSFL